MRVKYIGATDEQVRWGGNDDPRKILTCGQVYEVWRVEEHTWHTRYYLDGYEQYQFNSVCFEVVDGPVMKTAPER